MKYLKIGLKLFVGIFIFSFFINLYLFFLFKITHKNTGEKSCHVDFGLENRGFYISGVQFFSQAPLGTKQNWKIHNLSCEEATIGLYIGWLKKVKFDKFSFDKFLEKFVEWEKHKFGYQPTLSGKLMVRVINEYFTGVKAKLVENLNKTKISWILKKGNPIIIGISAKYLNNPYYHWKRYHTLLIVGETPRFYIVKDVGTKRGNDWYYPKDLILYAIRQAGSWGVVIEKKENYSNINIVVNKQNNLIYPTVLLKSFYDDLIYSKHNGKIINLPNDIKGGIISHHLLVAPLFDNYFRFLKQVKPDIKLFIVGGTNHFDFSDQIWTTNLNFWTPYGNIKISNLVTDLTKSGILKYNNQLFKREHSIFILVPFIKKYYPDAQILPFIVNNEVSKDKLEKLKNSLVSILKNDDVFYLQSTDFSHYIPDDVRQFYDLYSQNVLNDWDTRRVFNMWVDSQKLMFLTMQLLGILGYKKIYTLFNTSSNHYLGIKNVQNTSYFFSYIGKGQNKQKSGQISLLFGGDMILNFLSPFTGKCNLGTILCFQNFETGDQNESVEDYFFKGFDLLIFNLEGNFGSGTYEKDIKGGPIFFRYDKKYLKYLKNKLKVEVLFFSNNHQRDFGLSGISLTKKLMKQYGLKYIGNSIGFDPDQNVFIKQIGNRKVVVVNLNDVVTPLQDYDLKEIEKFIKKVKREKNIIVIIFIHRGREYFLEPTKRQIELGHKFIDWGADLVVGSHPHVIQPLEIYKGKRIYYSLGNITYDNDRQKKVIPDIDYGVFVGVNFNSSGVNFYEMPYKIIHKRPVMLWGDVGKKILNKYLYKKF